MQPNELRHTKSRIFHISQEVLVYQQRNKLLNRYLYVSVSSYMDKWNNFIKIYRIISTYNHTPIYVEIVFRKKRSQNFLIE